MLADREDGAADLRSSATTRLRGYDPQVNRIALGMPVARRPLDETDILGDPAVTRTAQPGFESAERSPAAPRPRVGVIASLTRPFCGDCARTRLTADGQIRNCLFAQGETDLRGRLRAGGGDAELALAWRTAMWAKRPGHGIDDPAFLQPDRPMSAIGG